MREIAGKTIRKAWRVNVRDIAEALGIEVSPFQWVTLDEAAEADPSWVQIAVWERIDA